MVIRKGTDNGRPIQRVGPVLRDVRAQPDATEGDEAIQEATALHRDEEGADREAEAYNRTEDGIELFYAGKPSGGRKLRDIDVIRLRRNEEQLSVNRWAQIYGVVNAVIWKAMKGYTYKHLNWNHPPLR